MCKAMVARQTKKPGLLKQQTGFTLVEVLISMALMGVGMLGLILSVNSVTNYQDRSQKMTQASLHCTNKLEEIKRIATNEPTGGAFGFQYLMTTYMTDEGMTQVDDWTYSKSETVNGMTRSWVIQVYPYGGSEDFTDPTAISMVETLVTTQWTDKKNRNHNVELAAVLHRRQFVE